VPEMVSAGLVDRSLARDLDRFFGGYERWPQMVQEIGWSLSFAVMVLGTVLLVIGRRRAGAAHVIRAVLGLFGLIWTLQALSGALGRTDWSMVAEMTRNNLPGMAVETLHKTLSGGATHAAMAAGGLLLASTVMLVWPARKTSPDGAAKEGA